MFNSIIDTDSYKLQHFAMYPSDTTHIYSYLESRLGAMFPEIKFFGLQYILNQLAEPITSEQLEEECEVAKMHGVPLNEDGFKKMIIKHNGKLPIVIKAVPEGMVVPINNVLVTICNTDKEFPWLTNYVETQLSRVWYPITVCTMSYQIKKMLLGFAEQTADSTEFVNFQLHDFGSRGVTCREQAGIGGMSHLVNFNGTDTLMGMKFATKYYGAPKASGYSVPATEHSIMTMRGEEGEKEVLRRCLDKYKIGILSVVIDSYDWKRFVTEYATEFKEGILNRDGKVVFRPDSGDPVKVSLGVFECLASVFGFTYNKKGFKVLNPKVGMLWGDGIDYDGIRGICNAFVAAGISTENIVFGSGGGLLQKMNRDTLRFAFKCSATQRDGEWHDVFKQPVDTSYLKSSKRGILKLFHRNGEFVTSKVGAVQDLGFPDILQTVFMNGDVIKSYEWNQVKQMEQFIDGGVR